MRGGAPASRELDLLPPDRLVERVDAVLLTGGSAHGLAAADGVMRWCEERGWGFPTPGRSGADRPDPRPVRPRRRRRLRSDPTPRQGHAGVRRRLARAAGTRHGRRGHRVDHEQVARTRSTPDPAGSAPRRGDSGAVVVAALVAVNASARSTSTAPDAAAVADVFEAGADVPLQLGASTTIGVVATNARLTKTECSLVAQSAHDGLARSVAPAHTRGDGDAFVTCATATEDAPVEAVRALDGRRRRGGHPIGRHQRRARRPPSVSDRSRSH